MRDHALRARVRHVDEQDGVLTAAAWTHRTLARGRVLQCVRFASIRLAIETMPKPGTQSIVQCPACEAWQLEFPTFYNDREEVDRICKEHIMECFGVPM